MMEAPAPNPPCTVNPCAIHASQSSEKSMTSPEPACRQSLPKLPLSDCGVTRTLCQPETQVYPESRLKCVPLHCKAAWSWAHFHTIETRRLCRTTPCRQPRGIRVGKNYQGACDDEEAQPLLERRGNLSSRLFYLVAAAGRDHGPDQKDRHRRRGDVAERS